MKQAATKLLLGAAIVLAVAAVQPTAAKEVGAAWHGGGGWRGPGWHGFAAARGFVSSHAWGWRGWGRGWGWHAGFWPSGGWPWGGAALGASYGVIGGLPPLAGPSSIYPPPPIVAAPPAIAPPPIAAAPPPVAAAPKRPTSPPVVAAMPKRPRPPPAGPLIGAAAPPPIVLLPPPVILAAAAAPPVIFAPLAFSLVIAPPVLAFTHIGPGFYTHGFIAGRSFAMRERVAVARSGLVAAGADERRVALRRGVMEPTRPTALADRPWHGTGHGRGFAFRRPAWRGPGFGGWQEARQGFGGWRGRWR
jgi:hypothetical protein